MLLIPFKTCLESEEDQRLGNIEHYNFLCCQKALRKFCKKQNLHPPTSRVYKAFGWFCRHLDGQVYHTSHGKGRFIDTHNSWKIAGSHTAWGSNFTCFLFSCSSPVMVSIPRGCRSVKEREQSIFTVGFFFTMKSGVRTPEFYSWLWYCLLFWYWLCGLGSCHLVQQWHRKVLSQTGKIIRYLSSSWWCCDAVGSGLGWRTVR